MDESVVGSGDSKVRGTMRDMYLPDSSSSDEEFSEATEYDEAFASNSRGEVNESAASSQALNQPDAEWRRLSRLTSRSGEEVRCSGERCGEMERSPDSSRSRTPKTTYEASVGKTTIPGNLVSSKFPSQLGFGNTSGHEERR